MDKLKRDDERESYPSYASVAQRPEPLAFTQLDAGSNPAGGIEGGDTMLQYLQWLQARCEVTMREVYATFRVPKQMLEGGDSFSERMLEQMLRARSSTGRARPS